MVIKKMSEIMDTSNKSEDTRDATDVIDPASDQEKTVEVSILWKEYSFSLPLARRN